MRHALTLGLILLGSLAGNAFAQDKAKGEAQLNADYRLRNTYLENEVGSDAVSPAHSNRIDQRFRFHLILRASERLSANATLLSDFALGQNKTQTAAEPRDGVRVNQAFGNWMVSDDFWIKFGRQNYQMGDGFVIGFNEWDAVPYAFDGVLFHYEVEFARIQLFAFKIRNYLAPAVAGGTGSVYSPDFQHNAYGIYFDLKTRPEVFRAVNLHVIKDAADRGDEAPSAQTPTVRGTQGMEIVRYGANVALAYGPVDLQVWYAGVAGKNKFPNVDALTYHGAFDINTSLLQGELGLNLTEWRPLRAFVQYHIDSGDRDAQDHENGTYDNYFHVRHASAGHMDLFDWGNLTSFQVGGTIKLSEPWTLGLAYWLLTRTETGPNSGRPIAGLYGGNLTPVSGTNDLNLNGSTLGNEVDLWADYQFSNGLLTTARAGYFRPGEVYNVDGGRNRTDGITQLMLEGRIVF